MCLIIDAGVSKVSFWNALSSRGLTNCCSNDIALPVAKNITCNTTSFVQFLWCDLRSGELTLPAYGHNREMSFACLE